MKNKMVNLICAAIIGVSSIIAFNLRTPELKDGVYRAMGSGYTFDGYKPFVTIEVSNGRMIDSKFDFIDASGRLMTEDRELRDSMVKSFEESASSITRILTSEFLITQSLDTVSDAVNKKSFADVYKKMVNELIDNSIKKGKTSPITVDVSSIKGGLSDAK